LNGEILYNVLILFILQGWTLYEILRYAPLHNWTAYEEALKTNPVLAKMMISGVVYSIGDWIAQVNTFLAFLESIMKQCKFMTVMFILLYYSYIIAVL